jgi:hypothetical protein
MRGEINWEENVVLVEIEILVEKSAEVDSAIIE